jgi:hypothetical protein
MDTVWDVRRRLDESFGRVLRLLGEAELSEDVKVRLAVSAEIRHHITLAERAVESLAKAEQYMTLEQAVMDALDTVSPDLAERVAEELDGRAEAARIGATGGRAGG